jgi:hypothetical protein
MILCVITSLRTEDIIAVDLLRVTLMTKANDALCIAVEGDQHCPLIQPHTDIHLHHKS